MNSFYYLLVKLQIYYKNLFFTGYFRWCGYVIFPAQFPFFSPLKTFFCLRRKQDLHS